MVSENDLKQAIVDLKYQEIGGMVKAALGAGIPPLKILDSLKSGLDTVGELYHRREYFLSELYMAGETMQAAMEVLMPTLSKDAQSGGEGTVVIGSIQGDIHDFGKAIAKTFLTASGFTVHDLGVDVPPARFVEEALKVNADIIGVSALLSSTQPISGEVVRILEKRGVRDKFKVILGGTAVTELAVKEFGVDAAVNDATEGVRIMKRWMDEKRGWE
jgi:methylmalonyl-CoA mutase cobalamin-binding domain/chain